MAIQTTEWEIIEAAYISRKGSYAKLATQFNVSLTTLKKRAIAGNWKLKRDETDTRIDTKFIEKIAELEATKRVDELFNTLELVTNAIKRCETELVDVKPKSWEGVMAIKIKLLELYEKLKSKTVQTDEGDEEFNYDPDFVESEEDLSS